MNFFDKDYIDYWKERVGSASDGSRVADEEIAEFYLRGLDINMSDKVLDLGCGHGRFFNLLSTYSNKIFGVDVTYEAINAASKYPYELLVKGTAEDSNLASEMFDKVVSWGVFDVVEQEKGLSEVNRILKTGGKFLMTGKNNDYEEDDEPAFIAERNAKLKDFPNHFTDVRRLLQTIDRFGFTLVHAFAFRRRGDLGMNRFEPIDKGGSLGRFYEFALLLQKTSLESMPAIKFCHEFSLRAMKLAAQENFQSPIEYFRWHKAKHNN